MKQSRYHQEKQARAEHFRNFVYGWILIDCGACSGSGYYDNNGSPKCSGCDGTGKERVRGTKANPPGPFYRLRFCDPIAGWRWLQNKHGRPRRFAHPNKAKAFLKYLGWRIPTEIIPETDHDKERTT